MAYDGLVVSATVKEFREKLTGGRIAKITQPEKDEVQLTVRNGRDNFRVQISANASLPLCCLTDQQKPSPVSAPVFLMTLRKHIGNGAITRVYQPDRSLEAEGCERVIFFEIEHLDEMGDLTKRILAVELMGKYSNIILLRNDLTIIDSIKRINASESSVREVLPNRVYFIPDANDKKDPLALTSVSFAALVSKKPEPLYQAIYHSITGLSPLTASELCFRAGLDPDLPANCQSSESLARLYEVFHSVIDQIVLRREPDPVILSFRGEPKDFSAFSLTSYKNNKDYSEAHFDSMSEVIRRFYTVRDLQSRMKQRSTDLRKVLNTLLDRTSKKLSLQEKQLAGTEDRDRFRLYGELLNTYGYSLKGGEQSLTCENFYDGKKITIPLNRDLSALENAKHYFERYDKLKRTRESVLKQLEESRNELSHLESIGTALDIAESDADLREIRKEMVDYGFLHSSSAVSKMRTQEKAKPCHFRSSDGYDIYVGRNNYQNEDVTFRIADGGDLWFHAKNVPGSHVIVKTRGEAFDSIPDRLFEEAASLAAYYSSHRADSKVDVDYTIRKNLRKVPNAAPGFVIYHTNYSITVKPEILVQSAE